MRIAILCFEKLPSFVNWKVPEREEILSDENLLIAEFESLGHSAYNIIWSDKSVNWNEYDIAIIRSTWDYIDRFEEFLSVLSEINASTCKLYNPYKTILWNSDKNYIFDLGKWGIPVVPTYKASVSDLKELKSGFEKNGIKEIIFKPVIGGGGADVHRTDIEEMIDKHKILTEKQPQYEYLIQPLVESVMTEGEYSFVYIGRELSHVLLKKPAEGNFLSHLMYGGSIEKVIPEEDDILQAEYILNRLVPDFLYVRLDLLRIDKKLSVIEVELIEPILFFNLAPGCAGKLAKAVVNGSLNKLK